MNFLSDFDSECKICLVPLHFFGGGKFNKPFFTNCICEQNVPKTNEISKPL